LASDSRLSSNGAKWDCGRKLFACKTSPDVFGYCGAVLFPSLLLGQITDAVDAGVLYPPEAKPELKFATICNKVQEALKGLKGFPELNHTFTILLATREGIGFGASFVFATLTWQPAEGWQKTFWATPSDHSDLVLALGSGSKTAKEFQKTWKFSEIGRTSRAVFSAFCDSIASGKDPFSGGPPQLVGLYLRGSAQPFGVIHNGACYLHGLPATPESNGQTKFMNALFEPCHSSGEPIVHRHARPKSLYPKQG